MAGRIPTLKARGRFKARLLLGLTLRPLRLFCERCDAYIPSDMVWVCSYCNFENRITQIYSFLNKCQNCKRPPKSYVCPRCTSVNFLDRDSDGSHPAWGAHALPNAAPTAAMVEEDPLEKKRREQLEEREDLQHQIEVARLNERLQELKSSTAFKQEVSAMERLEKSFSEHDAHTMGVHIIAKRERALITEQFKDDPEMRERAEASLTNWLEKLI